MRNRCIALLLVSSALVGSLRAEIYVDDNAPNDPAPFYSKGSDSHEDGSAEHPFDSIQEAIDVAVDGDTIIVAPGRYLSPDKWQYEELKFNGKNIRVVSSAPTDFAVSDQTVLCGVVIFDGTETSDCLLQGFKIQNHGHGGILGNGALARISHCIISGNGPCGATVVKDVQGRISNCLIVDNTTFSDCGVLPVVSGCAEFVNCTIANNLSGIGPLTGTTIVRNCIIYGNQGHPTDVILATRDGYTPPSLAYRYNLIENAAGGEHYGILNADPCFVRRGRWEDGPTSPTRATRGVIVAAVVTLNKVLVEGDYHLKTEGWRWSPQPIHGSHWYFDMATSPAIDAGDPIDSLGEELERAPDDPEGLWGVNHAVNLGAYGGTAQASLAPTKGEAPGVGAVPLHDYWPFTPGNRWIVHNPTGVQARQVRVAFPLTINECDVYSLWIMNNSNWAQNLYAVHADRTLCITQYGAHLNRLPQISEQFEVRYPLYPVVGSTIQTPQNPFVQGSPQYVSAIVMRGTLAEALAGTSVDPAQFLAGEWPDVIALREIREDGTTGDPIAIFARGFGPLMIAGQPVEGATVNSRTFGTATGSGTRATR